MATILKHKGRNFVVGTHQMEEYNELKAAERKNQTGARSVADIMGDETPIIDTPEGKQITSVDKYVKEKVAKRKEVADEKKLSLPQRIMRRFDKNYKPYEGRPVITEEEADKVVENIPEEVPVVDKTATIDRATLVKASSANNEFEADRMIEILGRDNVERN